MYRTFIEIYIGDISNFIVIVTNIVERVLLRLTKLNV